MKVSIIIPTYNSEKFISSTIDSILSQNYSDLECIIADGGSSDNTIEIIKKYKDINGDKIIYFSEKDSGVFDALNKGIKKATGDLIGWLGSDDIYSNNNIIKRAVDEIKIKNIDICWGDLYYVDRNDTNKLLRNWKSSPYTTGAFQRGWQLPHFASFIKKSLFESFGYFNIKYRNASDYDFFLRILEKHGVSSSYIPEVFIKMRFGGQSNVSIKNILEGNMDCLHSLRENKIKFNLFKLYFLKFFKKIKQFLH